MGLVGRPGQLEIKFWDRDILEPVYNLFRISTVKASTTICRLVLSFLSQFFQSSIMAVACLCKGD